MSSGCPCGHGPEGCMPGCGCTRPGHDATPAWPDYTDLVGRIRELEATLSLVRQHLAENRAHVHCELRGVVR